MNLPDLSGAVAPSPVRRLAAPPFKRRWLILLGIVLLPAALELLGVWRWGRFVSHGTLELDHGLGSDECHIADLYHRHRADPRQRLHLVPQLVEPERWRQPDDLRRSVADSDARQREFGAHSSHSARRFDVFQLSLDACRKIGNHPSLDRRLQRCAVTFHESVSMAFGIVRSAERAPANLSGADDSAVLTVGRGQRRMGDNRLLTRGSLIAADPPMPMRCMPVVFAVVLLPAPPAAAQEIRPIHTAIANAVVTTPLTASADDPQSPTPRHLAFEYSDAYKTRAKIHKYVGLRDAAALRHRVRARPVAL